MTAYQQMQPQERQLLVGKIVDLLVYDAEFCTEMIKVVQLKEDMGAIKGKFLHKAFTEDVNVNS